ATSGTMRRPRRVGQACGEGACAAAERASPPDVSMVVATSPAKPRRVSMGLATLPLPRVRCGAKARALIRAARFVRERLLPTVRSGNPRLRCASPRDALHPVGCCGRAFAYLPFPAAIGGRSASLLTVFLPTCPPPLSRNIAKATAISAPRMAPSVPFRALLSLIINSDHSDLGQRPCPTEVPAGNARGRNCGSLVAHGRSI